MPSISTSLRKRSPSGQRPLPAPRLTRDAPAPARRTGGLDRRYTLAEAWPAGVEASVVDED
jgi:hypothetical protein